MINNKQLQNRQSIKMGKIFDQNIKNNQNCALIFSSSLPAPLTERCVYEEARRLGKRHQHLPRDGGWQEVKKATILLGV